MSTSGSSPGYELKIESRPGYLYAYVKGKKDSVPIDRSYFSEVASQCKARHYDKVLIEEDLGTQLSTPDLFDVASWVPELGIYEIKISFVDRHPEHRPGNIFGETVAANRGIWVKVCEDVAHAEAWLLDSRTRPGSR